MNLEIRPYREGDEESIRFVIRYAFRLIGIPAPPEPGSVTEVDLDHIPDRYDRRGGFWVAVSPVTKIIIGTVAIYDQPEEGRRDTAKLKRMVVHPDWQGKGIGQKLLSHALEHCRAQGFAKVWLSTRSVMTTAHRLYERNGFVKTGESADGQEQYYVLTF